MKGRKTSILVVLAIFIAPLLLLSVSGAITFVKADEPVANVTPKPAAYAGSLVINLHGESKSFTPTQVNATPHSNLTAYKFPDGKSWNLTGKYLYDLIMDNFKNTDFTILTLTQINGSTVDIDIGDLSDEDGLIVAALNGTITPNVAGNYNKTWGDFIYVNEGKSVSFVENISSIEAKNHWVCTVTIQAKGSTTKTTEEWITLNNVTNYGTAYNISVAYKDYESGKSFNETVRGIAVKDIIAKTSAKSLNYSLKFVAADGWAGKIDYTYKDIELGIQEPAEIEDKDGNKVKLEADEVPIFAWAWGEEDDMPTNNTFEEGAFRVIVPGLTKNAFSKQVVEIRITTHGARPAGDIPGFPLGLVALFSGLGIVAAIIVKKHRF